MMRMKAMGFNTLQTYVAWNFHEPVRGRVDFSGDRDIEAFVALAKEIGLLVLLRPGPYICAEWEFGGFPAWLLADDRMRLRTYEPVYIAAISAWWSTLLSAMRKHLYHNGGAIVAVQIENEFGQYGDVSKNADDLRYMKHLVHLTRQILGPHVVLYTTGAQTPTPWGKRLAILRPQQIHRTDSRDPNPLGEQIHAEEIHTVVNI